MADLRDGLYVSEFYGIGVCEVDSQTPPHLLNIYPNPFAHITNIRFMIHDSQYRIGNPELRIYDATGRLVKSFDHESCIMDHGSAISWHGDDNAGRELPSGVYFLKFKAGSYCVTEKLLLIR